MTTKLGLVCAPAGASGEAGDAKSPTPIMATQSAHAAQDTQRRKTKRTSASPRARSTGRFPSNT